MKQEVLRLENVSCQENGVVQLDRFNLSILSGEIMGLLPVNSHGLTALLKLLQRNTPLRYGYVYYRERQINTWRTVKRRRNRIGLIQSESCLVEGLTVADNIFVLRPDFKTWYLRPSVLRKQLAPLLEDAGVRIPADAYVGELDAFEKVVVDILKSVAAGCRLIVLRDIGSDIGGDELKKIHRLLKRFTKDGISFLYIGFHFNELRQICGKIAFMSNGGVVKVMRREEFERYAGLLSSGSAGGNIAEGGSKENGAPVVFEARNLTAGRIEGMNFTVRRGECVFIQDADIRVLGEVVSVLCGETPVAEGALLLEGRVFKPKLGGDVAVIQELPTASMLFHEMSYLDNLCFQLDRRIPEIWRGQNVRKGVRREYANVLGDVFDKRVGQLSEPQKYELVYTRVLIQKPKAVFCVQPFRSADAELRALILKLIKRLTDAGISVVILAVNL
ncbi:MAG: ATP-binding cassette domain-containing protein [Clostridiales bacterium]|jgi:ribose transport system ATP-binding protein|nr:ATP-binding cassette domain-containing protein [Clostridiales bacterium]